MGNKKRKRFIYKRFKHKFDFIKKMMKDCEEAFKAGFKSYEQKHGNEK